MQSPCYKCDKRSISCHSECEDYLKFIKENESRREQEHKEKDIDRYIGEKYDKAARKARNRRK